MTNTFLILKDSYNREIRVRLDEISSYAAEGMFTTLNVRGVNIDVQCSVEEMDRVMTESFFMLKTL
jgi:hypothetical protein